MAPERRRRRWRRGSSPPAWLLGLLPGPLMITYFFELIRMYRAEYLDDEPAATTAGTTP